MLSSYRCLHILCLFHPYCRCWLYRFSVILSFIGIVYTYGISEHLGKDPDFYLLYKSSQKVKLAFFVLLPLMVETIYGIIEYFRR